MSLVDIFIGFGILVFVGLGFRDGFFKRIFGVLGFLAALIFATKFMTNLGEVLGPLLSVEKESANILAFIAIFSAVILVENLCYRWFGSTGGDSLPFWSRVCGGMVGAFQGAVAVSLCLIMLSIFDIPDPDSIEGSDFYEPVAKLAPKVFDTTTTWLPESKNFVDELKDKFDHINILQ